MNDQTKIDEVLRALDQSCPLCSNPKEGGYLLYFGTIYFPKICNTHLLEVKQKVINQLTIPSTSFVAKLQDELYHRGLDE